MKTEQSEILFISDLHLTVDRPFIIELFIKFVNERAIYAESLYILGDFFEYWVGDDDPAQNLEIVFRAFKTLKENDIPVFFMHGNRDFLIGHRFEKLTNCKLINDPTIINIYNTKVALLHGDSLCTNDTTYQKFKKTVRSDSWKKEFTEKSLDERYEIVKQLRNTSKSETSSKDEVIMDVEQTTVNAFFKDNDIQFMIHGHTHRPDVHHTLIGNIPTTRIVLGDWYEQGSVLSIKKGDHTESFSYELESFQ